MFLTQHWREVLERHQRAIRVDLHSFNGREVKSTEDGFLATFDGPAAVARPFADALHAPHVSLVMIALDDLGARGPTIGSRLAMRKLSPRRPSVLIVVQSRGEGNIAETTAPAAKRTSQY